MLLRKPCKLAGMFHVCSFTSCSIRRHRESCLLQERAIYPALSLESAKCWGSSVEMNKNCHIFRPYMSWQLCR